MLVKVSVENFKSFDKAAELTMISSNKIRTNANHRLKIKSTQLLKYAVVYGANASGKTNLALFFKFFKDSVCNGIPIEATQMFCKNRKENKERESSFEIQITVGDKFYAYGFSAVLSRRKVTGEWLYELYQNGSAKCLFEREGSKRPVLNDGITLINTEKNKFETYADDFEGNETSLFLTEMNRGKKYSTRSKLLFFRDVYDWIQNHISIITPDTPLIDLEYYYDDNSLKLINKLIKTFDTGISQVKIEEITLDELSNALPKSVFDKMMQHVKNRMEEQEEPSFRMTMRSKETFFNIEVEGHSEPKVTTIRLHHNKSFYEFGFDEESDGTRRLFDLMDMLLNKREDVLYVVDELAEKEKLEFYQISSATGEGVQELIDHVANVLKTLPKEELVDVEEKMVYTLPEKEQQWEARREGNVFYVTGRAVDRLMGRINIEDNESMYYFHKCLRNMGIDAKLRSLGICDGDTVYISDWELEWED